MSKETKNFKFIPKGTFISVARLLTKLQERLNTVGRESAQTKAELQTTAYTVEVNRKDADRQGILCHSRNLQQNDNLLALRDSTQKAFTQVKQDIADLLKLNQRLNERIGQLQSAQAMSAITPDVIRLDTDRRIRELEERIKQLEMRGFAPQLIQRIENLEIVTKRLNSNAATPSSIDQQVVNSKLSGVYDVTADLEARLQEVEAFRKGFLELQRVAEAFQKLRDSLLLDKYQK